MGSNLNRVMCTPELVVPLIEDLTPLVLRQTTLHEKERATSHSLHQVPS